MWTRDLCALCQSQTRVHQISPEGLWFSFSFLSLILKHFLLFWEILSHSQMVNPLLELKVGTQLALLSSIKYSFTCHDLCMIPPVGHYPLLPSSPSQQPLVLFTRVFYMCLNYKLGSIPKAPFSPTPPSSLLPLFWLLPEWGLPGPRKTHFLPSGRFPASSFTLHFPTWMKSKPMVVPAFHYSINTPLPHSGTTGMEPVGWSGTVQHPFCFLIPAEICRLIQSPACGPLTNSQNMSDWLCSRSSAFDHKPECGSWYFMHQQIEAGLIQRLSLNDNKVLSFYDRGLIAFFLVIRNNHILIKITQLSVLILRYLLFRKDAIISYWARNASYNYTEKSSFGDIIGQI